MADVHCLGIAVMDALSGPLSAYPEPRIRTQVVTDHVRFQPGGGAVNTASALARMGFSAALFSKVGDDMMGRALMSDLRTCGVDVGGVRVSPAESTPFTFVGVHDDGDRTFVHTPGANRTMSLSDFALDDLLDARYLLYQDLFVLPCMDVDAPALLAEARRRGVATVLDECWGFGPNREVFENAIPYCDYVTPSADDLAAMYPGASPDLIAQRLLQLGALAVVVKLGAAGCLVAQGTERCAVPALPAVVVDTTGAGDCWDAGFIAGLLSGEGAVGAAKLGSACAAFCVESIGGATGVPRFDRVQARSDAV